MGYAQCKLTHTENEDSYYCFKVISKRPCTTSAKALAQLVLTPLRVQKPTFSEAPDTRAHVKNSNPYKASDLGAIKSCNEKK